MAGLAELVGLTSFRAVQARAVLGRRPTPMAVARQLVTTYQTWLDQLLAGRPGSPRTSSDPSKESA